MALCAAALTLILAPAARASDWREAPVVPRLGPQVLANITAIEERGAALGNRPGVFAKVGDSITHSDFFLRELGCQPPLWGRWEWLAGTYEYFKRTTVSPNPADPGACGSTDSFGRGSVAAASGWTADKPLEPLAASPLECVGLSALDCEITATQPAIALVMFGTNDLKATNAPTFRLHLAQLAKRLVARGVIPVISTIPPRFKAARFTARSSEFNKQIAELAKNRRLPLWNYWRQLEEADPVGFAIGPDGVHPSQRCPECRSGDFSDSGLTYGYPLRNLGALRVLQKLRLTVLPQRSP